MYYYRARYYDAKAGRFITRDPIGFDGGDVNLYVYVGNNPVNRKDPSGKFDPVLFTLQKLTAFAIGKIIGFAGRDPTKAGARHELEQLKRRFWAELEYCARGCVAAYPYTYPGRCPDDEHKLDECINDCYKKYMRKMDHLKEWKVI